MQNTRGEARHLLQHGCAWSAKLQASRTQVCCNVVLLHRSRTALFCVVLCPCVSECVLGVRECRQRQHQYHTRRCPHHADVSLCGQVPGQAALEQKSDPASSNGLWLAWDDWTLEGEAPPEAPELNVMRNTLCILESASVVLCHVRLRRAARPSIVPNPYAHNSCRYHAIVAAQFMQFFRVQGALALRICGFTWGRTSQVSTGHIGAMVKRCRRRTECGRVCRRLLGCALCLSNRRRAARRCEQRRVIAGMLTSSANPTTKGCMSMRSSAGRQGRRWDRFSRFPAERRSC